MKFNALMTHLSELKVLNHVSALLDWDQQVNLPEKAGAGRSEQIEYLASTIHKRTTDPVLYELAQSCRADAKNLSDDANLVVSELIRTIEKQQKLPPAFVAEKARESSETFQLWQIVKPKGDWAAIESKFSKLVELYRKEGALLGGGSSGAYNALLDNHERNATIEELRPLFIRLAEKLSVLTAKLKERSKKPLNISLDALAQERICRALASKIGYDFSRGALNQAAHPFMTSLGADDYRITTHFHIEQPLSSVYSTLHEVGHALYEQGLPSQWVGTARGAPISLGIHESQSRFWENMIGRHRSFMPLLAQAFGAEGVTLSEQQLWEETNAVRPSFIRIEADEVTYSLHVVIRMLLESDLIGGALSVKDLPQAWNDMYQRYLGIRPNSHADGVLQDVHWYCGLMGYFPTYVLGNLYGGMMLETIQDKVGRIDDLIAGGDFGSILGWLRENVHQYGMKYQAKELIQKISGKPFSEEPFLNYLYSKFNL